jgi:hypothetical protein
MKKLNFVISILLMLMLSTGVLSQQSDTIKKTDPSADQASPGAGPGGRDLLQDTGGKSGLRGKSDTGRSINEQTTSNQFEDKRANDKYFSIGAALMIGIVLVGVIIRYRNRR